MIRDPDRLREVAHASARGAIAAMAMTGMRALTVDVDHLLYGLILSEMRRRPSH